MSSPKVNVLATADVNNQYRGKYTVIIIAPRLTTVAVQINARG